MSRHEGISRKPNGRWVVNVRVGGRRVYRTFDTQAEAIACRDQARDAGRSGRAVLDARTTRLTVGDFAAQYLDAIALTRSYGTQQAAASKWRALAPTFADVPVTALRVSHVTDWLARQTLARSTVYVRLALLRAILDRAAADLSIPNVARLADMPRELVDAPSSGPTYAMRESDAARLLDEVKPRYRLVIVLMLALGLRSGEARGLTLDRVDFRTGRVRIDRQLLRVKAGETPRRFVLLSDTAALAPLKTQRSYGDVWADQATLDAISEHVEQYGVGPEGLILTNRHGDALPEQTWISEVARLRRVTGIDLVGHTFRHARGSWALAAGATVADVAHDLRNSVHTTITTYVHPDEPQSAARTAGVMARLDSASARETRAERHLRAV